LMNNFTIVNIYVNIRSTVYKLNNYY